MKRVFVFTLALLAGCQSYRPAPIDAASTLASWRSRTLASIGTEALSSTDSPKGITLGHAESMMRTLNPSLRKARAEADLAQRSAEHAGRWDDPSIELNLERLLSSAEHPWVIGGLLNLSIPLSGRLGIEQKLAASEAVVARLRVRVQTHQALADLRLAWVKWSASVGRIRVLEDAVADLKSIDATTARLRDAGEVDPTDARLFSIDLVRRRAELLAERRENARLDARLRELIGVTPDAPLQFVPGTPLQPPATDPPAEHHPRVALAFASHASTERSLELEIRKQYPDLQVGGGLGSEDGDPRLLGGLAVPVPVLNANRRAIAEARAKRDVAHAEFESELIRLQSARAMVRSDRVAAQQVIDAIEKELTPLVDRQLAEARKLLEAGEFNPLLVREAIDAATETRLQLNEARESLDEAIVEHLSLTDNAFATPEEIP